MSITRFRVEAAPVDRAREVCALPNSTIREELLAIAQRHDADQ